MAEKVWKPEHPYIGVDLDGTLARDYGWRGAQHIGSPIKRMVNRIRRWHNEGKRVKIFTARAADPACIPPIKAWLKKHRLPDLEITNVKDLAMTQLWDDKAVPMRHNKGTRRDDGRIAESVNAYSLVGRLTQTGGIQATKVLNHLFRDDRYTHPQLGLQGWFQWRYDGRNGRLVVPDPSEDEKVAEVKSWLAKHGIKIVAVVSEEDWFLGEHIAESVVDMLLGEDDIYREFPNFQPYWVDPGGEIWHAWPGGHIEWGRRRLGLDREFQGVMAEMERRGWLRMVVRDQEVLTDTYKASPTQLKRVKDWTVKRHKMLYDERTQRQVDF